jgi:hypothetical protein
MGSTKRNHFDQKPMTTLEARNEIDPMGPHP